MYEPRTDMQRVDDRDAQSQTCVYREAVIWILELEKLLF